MRGDLGEFIRTERNRFATTHNNMFAFGFGAVQRYRRFLGRIIAQYDSTSAEYLAVHQDMVASMLRGSDSHRMSQAQVRRMNESERLGEDVQLQIESAYLFAKILLDRLARAVEFYFGPAKGLALDSHDDLTKRIVRYAETKGLQVPAGLAESAGKLKVDIADFRDQRIAHHKSPRTFRGFSLRDDEPRLLMAEIYPTAHDRQYESLSPRELIELIDGFTFEVIEFVVANREKSALPPVEKETEGEAKHVSLARKVGILAFGSLIGDEGPELKPLIVEQLDAETPFRVEFARRSKSRGYGPTLIPVVEGGAFVKAKVLILKDGVTVKAAIDMLYRRERHLSDVSVKYRRPKDPDRNDVLIERLHAFGSVETVLYTRIGANIQPLTAANLARLAISSVAKPRTAPDGISYLLAAKENGIVTALSADYEREVLEQTGTGSLKDALATVTPRVP